MVADALDDRDFAFMVLDNLSHDYDAQLRAIHELLSLHRRDTLRFGDQIRALEWSAATSAGLAADRAVDETVDHYHHSVYRDAAFSMAAVGMLAPFVESLFVHAFNGLRALFNRNGLTSPAHPRWSLPADRRWDCRVDQHGRRGIAKGIPDLAKAIGLRAEMPADVEPTLEALFRYRNAMFHLGLEWPTDERAAFVGLMANWPAAWFSQATSGGEPWVIYLSDDYVDHVLATIEQSLQALGRFIRPIF
jgi:hypothetical protein